MSKLLVERQDAVTVLTLNRPDVHNNVDDETAMLLADAIDAFAADDRAKVLVITAQATGRSAREPTSRGWPSCSSTVAPTTPVRWASRGSTRTSR